MIPTNPATAPRLVAGVALKLSLSEGVTLARWKENKDGSHTPVFSVPSTHAALARELGLLVKAYD